MVQNRNLQNVQYLIQNFFLSHATVRGMYSWLVFHAEIRRPGSFQWDSLASTRSFAWPAIGRRAWRRQCACFLGPRAQSADVTGCSCSQDQNQLQEMSSSHVPRHRAIIIERKNEFSEELTVSALGLVFDPHNN